VSVYSDLVGQEHVVEILQKAVAATRSGQESQEMTHAWVFTGPPGSGRSSAAIAFAQALVCSQDGCGICNECKSAANGAHPDVEVIVTEGLSIKIDEVEEPGNRTVWLLCAPTLHDVLPTIRSRCRHLQLVTPSNTAVAQVLQTRDGISPVMADFAARVSQGHIGRARYLANNESVRNTRNTIMKLPLTLQGISSAFAAAQTLVDLATEQATTAAELRNEKEVDDLSLAYGKGATGRGMATGGSKAIKDLEKEQKTRQTRMIRDGLDAALLDIATFYRDVMMVQAGANDALINTELEAEIRAVAAKAKPQSTIKKINAIMDARTNLGHNAAPLLTVEALMCVLAR